MIFLAVASPTPGSSISSFSLAVLRSILGPAGLSAAAILSVVLAAASFVDLVSIFESVFDSIFDDFSLSAPLAESAILSEDFVLPLSDAFPFSAALLLSDGFSSVL